MTPQAYSYPTVGPDKKIYVPPYGLNSELDKLLIIDPITYDMEVVQLDYNGTLEKYTHGIVIGTKIYWLPYGESRVLIFDTIDKSIKYLPIPDLPKELYNCKGKFVMGHLHNNKIFALPYGESMPLDYILVVDLENDTTKLIKIENIPNTDCKKWHQSVLRGNSIIAVPRGERRNDTFNHSIEFNCDTGEYTLTDMSSFYPEYSDSRMKYTTIAIINDVIYAPPYGYVNEFDYILINKDNTWHSEHTGINQTTRKYFTHVKTKNNKLYFPPAGHHVDWDQFLIIDGITGNRKTFSVDVGNETKKYFAGIENSLGKVYYIPRGGCVCDPFENWKKHGDLAKVLVIDSKDDSHYTVDISECFTDSTTIEKYNACCIVNDIIFAFPYGESESFQTVLVFDTISETIIKTIDLNELQII